MIFDTHLLATKFGLARGKKFLRTKISIKKRKEKRKKVNERRKRKERQDKRKEKNILQVFSIGNLILEMWLLSPYALRGSRRPRQLVLTDGWMDGWMGDGWMDGWMGDGLVSTYFYSAYFSKTT